MTASIRGGIFTMAMLLKGAEVAKALTEELHAKTEELKKNGVEPCLAIQTYLSIGCCSCHSVDKKAEAPHGIRHPKS